jgi:hypothetical protein
MKIAPLIWSFLPPSLVLPKLLPPHTHYLEPFVKSVLGKHKQQIKCSAHIHADLTVCSENLIPDNICKEITSHKYLGMTVTNQTYIHEEIKRS